MHRYPDLQELLRLSRELRRPNGDDHLAMTGRIGLVITGETLRAIGQLPAERPLPTVILSGDARDGVDLAILRPNLVSDTDGRRLHGLPALIQASFRIPIHLENLPALGTLGGLRTFPDGGGSVPKGSDRRRKALKRVVNCGESRLRLRVLRLAHSLIIPEFARI